MLVVPVIGGNLKMVRKMDMEHSRVLVESDTSGNTSMVREMGMEYSDSVLEEYITESGKTINTMGMDLREILMEINTGDSTKTTRNGVTEYPKRMECYTMTYIRKASASTEVKFNELPQFLNTNK